MSKKTIQEKQRAREKKPRRRAHRRGRRPNSAFTLPPGFFGDAGSIEAGELTEAMTDMAMDMMIRHLSIKLGRSLSISMLQIALLVKEGVADSAAPEFECIPRPDETVQ